jgi:hypothetical protein
MMFIMGDGTNGSGEARQSEASWPVGVEENGSSDWGTPGKELPRGCN